MPLWLNNKWIIGLLAGAVIATALFLSMHALISAGENTAKLAQATSQIKLDNKVKKDYAVIDRETPGAADKRAAIDWLRRYTRAGQ